MEDTYSEDPKSVDSDDDSSYDESSDDSEIRYSNPATCMSCGKNIYPHMIRIKCTNCLAYTCSSCGQMSCEWCIDRNKNCIPCTNCNYVINSCDGGTICTNEIKNTMDSDRVAFCTTHDMIVSRKSKKRSCVLSQGPENRELKQRVLNRIM